MHRRNLLATATAAGITTALASAADTVAAQESTPVASPPPAGAYAELNGLQLYYEVHGAERGNPLVLLHGAFMNIDITWSAYLPALAAEREVIAIEPQGHGRTNDRDTPLSYATMADDVIALLDLLGLDRVDVVGYSMGASTGVQLAVAHPARVGKLVVISTAFARSGIHPEQQALLPEIKPEFFLQTPIYTDYVKYAPNPDGFADLVAKVVAMELDGPDFTAEQIAATTAPTLLIFGDSDGTTLSHAVHWFELLGGGVPGDLAPLPASQLGIIPGASHITLLLKADQILPMMMDFVSPAT